MQLSLAPMQINKIHLCPLGIWMATLECSQNVCSMKSCSCCQLAQLVENSTNEAKVAGLASLDSSVPWPQTSPLASASHPQSMCLWSQSRLGEKVQMNQFKSITTTRKTTQSTCPADYGYIAPSSCVTHSHHTSSCYDFIGSHFSPLRERDSTSY